MKLLIIITSFYTISLNALAQKAKSKTALFSELITVCGAYKQVPLQATLNLYTSSNIVKNKIDTVSAELHLQEHGIYLKLGAVEQLANDSMQVMIFANDHRMILTRTTAKLSERFVQILSPSFVTDNEKMLKSNFDIRKISANNENSMVLTSKKMVTNSNMPRIEITIFYDAAKKLPLKIQSVERKLHYVPDSTAVDADMTVITTNSRKFVIQEDRTSYEYNKVTFLKNKLPLQVSELVQWDTASNRYIPILNYRNFNLLQK
jgi:hypothetical protein